MNFITDWDKLASDAFKTDENNGFWEKERNDGELIALMHSELSEALESLRHGNPPSSKIPEFSGVEAEFADVVLRIMIMAHARNLDIGGAILAKMEFNKGREFKHGGKAF